MLVWFKHGLNCSNINCNMCWIDNGAVVKKTWLLEDANFAVAQCIIILHQENALSECTWQNCFNSTVELVLLMTIFKIRNATQWAA